MILHAGDSVEAKREELKETLRAESALFAELRSALSGPIAWDKETIHHPVTLMATLRSKSTSDCDCDRLVNSAFRVSPSTVRGAIRNTDGP